MLLLVSLIREECGEGIGVIYWCVLFIAVSVVRGKTVELPAESFEGQAASVLSVDVFFFNVQRKSNNVYKEEDGGLIYCDWDGGSRRRRRKWW